MPATKVSVTVDEEILAEARGRVGGRGLSAYVTEALRRQLQRDRIGELLAHMEEESGPVPEELVEQARSLWQRNVDVAGRRSSATSNGR